MRVLARLLRDRRANVATMSALALPVAIILAAVAIDEGALYTERRETQALTDLAAITAAANLGKAEEAVLATLQDNGVQRVFIKGKVPPSTLPADIANAVIATVQLGRYAPSSLVAVTERFEANGTPHNAVKVTLEKQGTRYFASSLIEAPKIGTHAIAGTAAEAAFSVGSRLASVNGGVLNALLGALIGGNVSLSVMDYNALLSADVSVFSFIEALATELRVEGASYDEVLASDATVGQVARAMAGIHGIDNTSRLALLAIANGGSARAAVPLSHLFDLGDAGELAIGQQPPGLAATANALEILSAAAAIANGTNQVRLNLGASVPGLAETAIDLAIGEPPQHSSWFAIGEAGEIVRTAQTRLLLTLKVGGPGGLLGTTIKLPVYAELAFAEAKLTDVSCPTGRPDSTRVSIAARPGVAQLRVADIGTSSLADFSRAPTFNKATLVAAPLVTVTGKSLVEISNMNWKDLTFSRQEIANKTIKSVSTRDVTQSLTTSLIGNLDLEVKLAVIGIGVPSVLKSTLLAALAPVTPAVDGLLYSVLTTLGVRIGEADVRVTGATCGRAVLVQ